MAEKHEQLRALITQLNLDGLEEIAEKIQQKIESGERITRKQVKQLKAIRDEQVKTYQDLLSYFRKPSSILPIP